MDVGVIGLGAMGSGIASSLVLGPDVTRDVHGL
jgi:3-hydroxyisobutyrate dehydrogenase-like beta-hydroxyacid dehydrogenase